MIFNLIDAKINLGGDYRMLRGLRTIDPMGLPSTKYLRICFPYDRKGFCMSHNINDINNTDDDNDDENYDNNNNNNNDYTPTWNMADDMKIYSSHLIFTFYLNRDTSVVELFPVIVFQ